MILKALLWTAFGLFLSLFFNKIVKNLDSDNGVLYFVILGLCWLVDLGMIACFLWFIYGVGSWAWYIMIA